MGAWGTGNLENDDAQDEIYDRSVALVDQLWTRIQKQKSWEADEEEYGALFVDLETLFALEAGGVFNGQRLTELEDVDAVLSTWLSGWSEYFPDMAEDDAVVRARREVIEATFARFREITAKHSQQ